MMKLFQRMIAAFNKFHYDLFHFPCPHGIARCSFEHRCGDCWDDMTP